MKSLAAFMIGCGTGAAAVNLTLVPHGHNEGFFVGAAFCLLGSGISFIEAARCRKKD